MRNRSPKTVPAPAHAGWWLELLHGDLSPWESPSFPGSSALAEGPSPELLCGLWVLSLGQIPGTPGK